LPLALYRLGLGRLLGHEFLLLEHLGRQSGRVHETVLKVLRYDAATREIVVASAWGAQTDWYRNLQARAPRAVRCGRDWYVPDVRTLAGDEAYDVFVDWTHRERWFADLMLAQIGLSWDLPESERRALVARFPFVAFRPSIGVQVHELAA
jgi:deazaflavin-dependent oxidoreductase (nitroreductase family)